MTMGQQDSHGIHVTCLGLVGGDPLQVVLAHHRGLDVRDAALLLGGEWCGGNGWTRVRVCISVYGPNLLYTGAEGSMRVEETE